MKGIGDVPGSPAYHADLTCASGVRFVWRGRVTSVIGQNVPRSLGGIWKGSEPLRSSRTILKEASKATLARCGDAKYGIHATNQLIRDAELRDGRTVYEFLRANPHFGGVSCGDNASGVADVLTPGMLDRLVARGGAMILYTHLGKVPSTQEPFNAATRAALWNLAQRCHDESLLVTTTRRVLGFAAALRTVGARLRHGRDGSVQVDLQLPSNGHQLRPGDLDGMTVYVPDASRTRLFVEGREITALQRNPADETGRPSVTIPWTRLEFPQVCA